MKSAKNADVRISKILADKEYDAEYIHESARTILGDHMKTVIPTREYKPKSRRSAHENYPRGWYRSRMFFDFDFGTYVLRSLVEAVNSMIKRKMGEIVFGKTLASMARGIKFACIAHNVRLLIDSGLVRIWGFPQSRSSLYLKYEKCAF